MARRRPLGITILGSLAVVAGIVLLILGLFSLLAIFALEGFQVGPQVPAELFLISALLNIIVGAVLLASGNGLLNLRPWAWWVAALVALIGIARSILSVLSGVAQAAPSGLLGGLLSLVLLLVFLAYLLSVRGHFR